MENKEQQLIKIEPQRVHHNLKSIMHFAFEIPLPAQTQLSVYSPKFSSSGKKKKLKNKFENFHYYKHNQTKQMYKVLFLTDQKYVDQGKYPFTQPEGKICNFSDLNVKRMKVTEAAYIGHTKQELIIKKIEGVKLGQNGTQFQTVDQKFEVIKIGNEKRFNQFVKLMGLNKNSISMSIRVIIDETDNKIPEVIDYQFFYREKQLINKHSQSIKK